MATGQKVGNISEAALYANAKAQADAAAASASAAAVAAGNAQAAAGKREAAQMLAKLRGIGMASEGRPCAITRKDSTSFLAYRPIGGKLWQEIQLSTGGIAGGPYSWNQTRIVELMSYLLSTDAAVTYTGSWNDLTSQAPNTYVGGRGKYASYAAGTEKVEITATFGGDLYVIWIGRTTGGYVKVEIDGDTEKASALPSTGAYRYLDTYTAADLSYKQRTKVATGLPYGSHTVRLTPMTDRNAANTSGASRFYWNGLGFVSPELGLPSQTDTRAPEWKTGTVYAAYSQVQYQGRSYSTAAGGTSGATPPTHTSGSVSDGGVTWLYMTASSYDLTSHTVQAAGSQLEYAYEIQPSGQAREDVGGIVHGNETLTALSLLVDGDALADLAVGSWVSGETISVSQSISATHTISGVVALQTLRHEVSPRGVVAYHDHAWQVAAAVGYFYPAMWPLLHWGALESRWCIDALWTPQAGKKLPSDYYGQANPIVGKTRDFLALAWGDVLMSAGTGGVPSGATGPLTAVLGLYVPPESVNEYDDASSVFAGLAMNLSGASAPGGSSVSTKLYFERTSLASPAMVAPGDVWRSTAVYLLSLVPSSSYDPVST